MAFALVAALGVLAVARAPRGGPAVSVLVAARTLGAGAAITPGSVRLVRWPTALVPEGALAAADQIMGRRLTGSLGSGEVLTAARVSGAGVLQGQPPGTLAVHVALADPGATAMVRAGDSVDLVGPDGVVARAVRVLAVDAGPAGTGGLMGSASASSGAADGPGLVVGVDEAGARAIAGVPADAMGRPSLTLLLRAA